MVIPYIWQGFSLEHPKLLSGQGGRTVFPSGGQAALAERDKSGRETESWERGKIRRWISLRNLPTPLPLLSPCPWDLSNSPRPQVSEQRNPRSAPDVQGPRSGALYPVEICKPAPLLQIKTRSGPCTSVHDLDLVRR